MKRLHYGPGNANLAPHMVLRELGETFELVLIDRANNAHKSPAYLKLNPNGLIPVYEDGDLVLFESAAIVLHLCDTHPDSGLAPALGTPERAHFYKWLLWLNNTMQPAVIQYFYCERWVAAGNTEGAAQVKQAAERSLIASLAILDAELARHGGPFVLGERFSAVDLFATMVSRWTRNLTQPARSFPHVGPWLERMVARPSVAATFEAEGLAKPWV